MLLDVSFKIDGTPVSKARPRFCKTGHAFTPAKTKNYEAWVKTCAKQAMQGRSPTEGPVDLKIHFIMDVPKSWPAWKQQAALRGIIFPTGKPDVDNLTKAIKDAGNSILWKDDSQVVRSTVAKSYGEAPFAYVSVFEIETVRSAIEWWKLVEEGGLQ